MPVIPDIYADLEHYGLTVMGLCVEPREDGSHVSVAEVSAYLAARGVLATLTSGALFGTCSSVVVNVLIHTAESTDQSAIAIASHDQKIARGQSAEEFVLGLCHSLGAPITIDDEVRFHPGSTEPVAVDPEQEPVEHSRALTVFRGAVPHSAYQALLLLEGEGAYGIVADHQLVIPARGYTAIPRDFGFHREPLPAFVFSQQGERRFVALHMATNKPFAIGISTAHRYEQVLSVAEDSDVARVIELISTNPLVLIDEDLPHRPKRRGPRTTRRSRDLVESHRTFDSLSSRAEELAQTAPSEFFATVAEAAGLPREVIQALREFEEQPSDSSPSALGQIPLTPVAALPEGWWLRFRMVAAMYTLLFALPPGRSGTFKAFVQRLRGKISTQVIAAIAFSAFSIGCGLLALWPSVVAEDGFENPVRIFAAVSALFFLQASAFAWSAIGKLAGAKALLDQARKDGVLPY
jgi:hypothetical protein